MRVASVVGARPQFVKAALVSRAFAARGVIEWLVHTGQHYDDALSSAFFFEFGLPQPYAHLGVASTTPLGQLAEMLARLESVLRDLQPDCVLVYGDTTSTLAGALAAAKLDLPLVHVEAGVRSFDAHMPEEQNRVVTDRLASLLLTPSAAAAGQLRREGIAQPTLVVGDVMVDLARAMLRELPLRSPILDRFALRPRGYVLATIHRASNTAEPLRFSRLIAGLRRTGLPVVFPVHPRTRELVASLRVDADDRIFVCEPLGYRESLALQRDARSVVTDSGGIQKEALVVGTPCVTLRDRTEWPETLEYGWNVLADDDPERIANAALRPRPERQISPFLEGNSADRIVDALFAHIAADDRAQPCVS